MGKARNPEQYGPRFLLHLMGLEKAKPAQVEEWRGWLRNDLRDPDGYRMLLGGGSANHPYMLQAARLWLTGEERAAAAWWKRLLRYVLGDEAPPLGEEALGFFHHAETNSPDYEAMRFGSVAAVATWARQLGNGELLGLARRYLEVDAALSALLAVPAPDSAARRNRRGVLNWTGPEVSPVGERSNDRFVSEMAPLFAHAVGWTWAGNPAWLSEQWPFVVARAGDHRVDRALAASLQAFVRGDLSRLPEIRRILAPIRFWAELHVTWWREGRLVHKPCRQNGNTPCNLWGWWEASEGRMYTGYPWPPGRAPQTRGAGDCRIAEEGGSREIVARTEYGAARRGLPSGPPLLRVVLTDRGLNVD